MTRTLARTFLLCLVTIGLLGACASGGGGSSAPSISPEEAITSLVQAVVSELAAGNIDTVMASYAEDFTWDQGDRASMQAFLQNGADAGFLDGMTSNTEAMEISVDGDTATVEGVTVEGAFGLLDLSFELANRAGKWLITKQMQQ